jgi:hypothetical protein
MVAYIEVETKMIWRWQLSRYVREGWSIDRTDAWLLRVRVERCIG